MWGRIIGVFAGLALLAEGYLLWRPQTIGAWPDPDLGPFTPYRTIVAGLAAIVGLAVVVAALQRTAPASGPKALTVDWDGPVEPPPPAPEHPAPEPLAAEAHTPAAAPAPTPAVDEHTLDPFPGTEAHEPAAEPAALARPATPAASGSDYGAFLAATAEGDQLRAAGNLSDAIDPYSQALAIARTRHAAWPDDPAVRRELAGALTNVADVHDRDGRLDSALDLHQQSLDLRRALAAAAPANVTAQLALSTGLERLADTREARGHRSRARDLFRERLALTEGLAAAAPDNASIATDLKATRERLAELDEALS